MRKTLLSIVAMTSVVFLLGLASTASQPGRATAEAAEPDARIRVGTYDNRAVTIAWFHSEFQNLGELHERAKAAEDAGDQALIDELSQLGGARQRKLHFQGFGRAPVTDLLEPVKDRLGEVAAAAGVHVIVFECNFTAEGVEVVDVTDELIKLYDPTDEALAVIADLRKQDPVPLQDLNHDH